MGGAVVASVCPSPFSPADNLTAGFGQLADLFHGGSDVFCLGIGHRLNDHLILTADLQVSNLDRTGFRSFSHEIHLINHYSINMKAGGQENKRKKADWKPGVRRRGYDIINPTNQKERTDPKNCDH